MESRTPLQEALDDLLLRSLTAQDAQARRWATDAPGRAYSPPVLQSVVQQFASLFTTEEVKASLNRLAEQGEMRFESECSPDGLTTAIYVIPVSRAGDPPAGYPSRESDAYSNSYTPGGTPSLPPGHGSITIEQW